MPIPPVAIMSLMPAAFERIEIASAIVDGGLIVAASRLRLLIRTADFVLRAGWFPISIGR